MAVEAGKLPKGEKISLEKMTEIFNRLYSARREFTGGADPTRGTDGEYYDYIEKRRPFTEANNLRYTH
jgi:hypothetical protein